MYPIQRDWERRLLTFTAEKMPDGKVRGRIETKTRLVGLPDADTMAEALRAAADELERWGVK